MKTTTLSILALTVLAAGCSSKPEYNSQTVQPSQAKSPWSYDGTGSTNPITKAIQSGPATDENAPVKTHAPYSWDKKPKAVAQKKAQPDAPEEPGRLVITEVNEDYGVFAFKVAQTEKLDPNKFYNVNDGKNAARVRVVSVSADNTVVADLLPNQVSLPDFAVGVLLSYASIE